MDLPSPLPALACLLAAVATAALLVRQRGAPPRQGRFAAIDGLRGYLALFVFLDHADLWYSYVRTGKWGTPTADLYTFFGVGGVAMFFMVTGFLFFSKLLDARQEAVDWARLFVSRFLRLTPMYLFVMLLLLVLVAARSGGGLRQPLPELVQSVARWLGFTVLGSPDVNGVAHTFVIVAGVTWSLPYEWFFYFCLPLLALVLRPAPPLPYVLLGLASLAALWLWQPQRDPLLCFLGGIAAACMVSSGAFRDFAARRICGLLVMALVVTAFAAFRSYATFALLLLAAAFSLVAGGNGLFGVLLAPASRILGEMSYSIYLLHGMVLFVTFTFLIGPAAASEFAPATHWAAVIALSPILVLASAATFRLIERPAMRSAGEVTDYLRSRLARRRAAAAARQYG